MFNSLEKFVPCEPSPVLWHMPPTVVEHSNLKVLIIGSGAREHALYEKIKQSPLVGRVICVPGNGGIPTKDRLHVWKYTSESIVRLAKDEKVDLVVIGEEGLIFDGLVDILQNENILVFGPSIFAAKLEASKVFTKRLCNKLGIPTAKFSLATDFLTAKEIIRQTGFLVIKADGPCHGKDVEVCDSEDDAIDTAKRFLVDMIHGQSGALILIEERLIGREVSVMAFCDGENVILLPPVRDYKRAYDGDEGPNTGGMGAYCPVSYVKDDLLEEIKKRIIMPTLRGMTMLNTPFRGLLYAGIMITKDGPKLIEYNVRFGDPEAQTVLSLIKSDIVPYLLACCEKGGLAKLPPLKVDTGFAVCTVIVSEGYPSAYKKDIILRAIGIDEPFVSIFHAGTERGPDCTLVSSGGRVISVVGTGVTLESARFRSQDIAGLIVKRSDSGLFYRKDITLNI